MAWHMGVVGNGNWRNCYEKTLVMRIFIIGSFVIIKDIFHHVQVSIVYLWCLQNHSTAVYANINCDNPIFFNLKFRLSKKMMEFCFDLFLYL